MIKIKELKYFYKKKEILDIKKLIINDGEKIALVGLNGAGKTTLGELILNLHSQYQGVFTCDKEYIYNAVFQEANFHADINLKEIFYLYCHLYKIKENHVEHFEKFDLIDVQKSKFKKISGGQQQKFKFLISLLNNPNFLFLDEISTSMDYEWRVKIIKVVYDYIFNNDNVSLLLISHNPEEVAKICERVIFLEKGKIINDFKLEGNYETKLKTVKKMVNIDV